MNFAVDYDKTFSADPEFFKDFVALAKTYGHSCYLVTQRGGDSMWVGLDDDDVRREVGELMPIIWCGTKGKREKMIEMGIQIDVWIDDNPHYIDFFWPLRRIEDHG